MSQAWVGGNGRQVKFADKTKCDMLGSAINCIQVRGGDVLKKEIIQVIQNFAAS